MFNKARMLGACVLAAVMAAGLAGCNASGGGAQGGGSAAGSAASGPVTITLMNQNDETHKYFSTLGDDFTKLNPNIKLDYIGVPNEQFDAKLQTMIASNTAPDITTHVASIGYMEFYAKGLLTDLTPYIQKYNFDPVKVGIPDSAMKMATIEGKVYGIPLNIFTTVLLYNKDLFDKAGVPYPPADYSDASWTFEKMVDIAGQLTSGTGNDMTYGLLWIWNGGGAMQDPDYFGASLFPPEALVDGRAKSNNFAQPDVISAYQNIADLAYKYKVSPSPTLVAAMAGSDDSDPFYSGKIAMEVEGAWGLAGINDLPFKVGVAAVPVGNAPKVRAVTYIDPYFVMSGSKHPDEAFQYIAFLAQPDNQIKMVQQSDGNPPASTQALDTYYSNFSTIDPKDLKNTIEGSFDYSEEDLEHMINGAGQIHVLIANEMSPVDDGSKSAEEVCVPLQDKLNAMLADINK